MSKRHTEASQIKNNLNTVFTDEICVKMSVWGCFLVRFVLFGMCLKMFVQDFIWDIFDIYYHSIIPPCKCYFEGFLNELYRLTCLFYLCAFIILYFWFVCLYVFNWLYIVCMHDLLLCYVIFIFHVSYLFIFCIDVFDFYVFCIYYMFYWFSYLFKFYIHLCLIYWFYVCYICC